ncbi:MAG: AAA family ATPase [Clostridia bacterium]|nr:AAA family ATPase [Clostridia bacterium]NCC75638.1 AAA family ATPase [Clostridia bacterium]
MVKVIVGGKGSGKTSQLVDELNAQAYNDAADVVCIEYSGRLNRMVKYKIRLIDILEYPVKGYRELLAFIAGIYAEDYDLTHLYIDTITKVAGDSDLAHLEQFLRDLDEFSTKNNLNATIIFSADPANLPEGIRQYC